MRWADSAYIFRFSWTQPRLDRFVGEHDLADMREPTGNPRGRPTKFNYDVAVRIIERMAEGCNEKRACQLERIKPSTFRNWVRNDYLGIRASYERAQRLRALMMDIELDDILDSDGLTAAQIEKSIGWRERFIDAWLPGHLQPPSRKFTK
jgi:hypothetical protein